MREKKRKCGRRIHKLITDNRDTIQMKAVKQVLLFVGQTILRKISRDNACNNRNHISVLDSSDLHEMRLTSWQGESRSKQSLFVKSELKTNYEYSTISFYSENSDIKEV